MRLMLVLAYLEIIVAASMLAIAVTFIERFGLLLLIGCGCCPSSSLRLCDSGN